MYIFSELSHAESEQTAYVKSYPVVENYKLKRLSYPDIYIPNRAVALNLSLMSEDSEHKCKLRAAVEAYNQYLNELEAIPGFVSAFAANHCHITREYVSRQWSEEIAALVFSKKTYIFHTDLRIIKDCLFDDTVEYEYETVIAGQKVSLPIGEPSEAYVKTVRDKALIWNWVDNGHDFCFSLWELLGQRNHQNEDNYSDNEVSYSFDYYEEFRTDYVEPQLVRAFKKIESLGYIKTYTVRPEADDPRWKRYCKSDGSLDVAVVDKGFVKNKLLMEQLELILWTSEEKLKKLPYFLTNSKGCQELSPEPGHYGGHNKLKIYGKLDCPSANKYIASGQYIQHRVFFKDEKIAIMAGYRPCAKCMPAEYKKWKESLHECVVR